MTAYEKEFYVNRHEKTIHAANTILSMLLDRIPTVHSAVDVGCGTGTWLSVLQQKGVNEIQGFDGSWMDRNLLAIPYSCFTEIDLTRSMIRLITKYDLAISLEVAEHLPSDCAEEFIFSLTELSDYVLFSAAIPFQGGQHHVNEQWQHYWVELFRKMDYLVYDIIRPKIWNDNRIPFWYRQNILLFVRKQKTTSTLNGWPYVELSSSPIDIVHPDLYLIRQSGKPE
ncbi:MAG: methyltransferase domain-containing protein [Chlorobium sp.]|jgi:hypothetical protein|nr:methyltransferase domain-containing protein [Chlorobium sp.]